jgi:hypothetical protein
MQKCYRSINRQEKQVEAIKFLDWKENDPKSFKNSKLIKYEKVKIITGINGELANAYVQISASDRSSMMGIKELMIPITEEEYHAIVEAANAIIKLTISTVSKLNENLKSLTDKVPVI